MQQVKELILSIQKEKTATYWRDVMRFARKITLDDLENVPEMEMEMKWNWEMLSRNNVTPEMIDETDRMKEAERNAIFEEILTGELKTLNTTLEFLLEENFSYGYLILAEVVRLHTILLLKRLGASEEIKELCYFI